MSKLKKNRTETEKKSVSSIQTKNFILFGEKVVVDYTNHTKHKNTLCESIPLQVEYLLTTVTEIVTFYLDIRSVLYLLNQFLSIINTKSLKPTNIKE
jgi:hypothetical protein